MSALVQRTRPAWKLRFAVALLAELVFLPALAPWAGAQPTSDQ